MSASGYERTFPRARYYDRSQVVSRYSGRLRQPTGMEPTADDLLAAGDRDGQATWLRYLGREGWGTPKNRPNLRFRRRLCSC
jgi:hypothetical protein